MQVWQDIWRSAVRVQLQPLCIRVCCPQQHCTSTTLTGTSSLVHSDQASMGPWPPEPGNIGGMDSADSFDSDEVRMARIGKPWLDKLWADHT
eukprot:2370033-Amphidinium_carterae.2